MQGLVVIASHNIASTESDKQMNFAASLIIDTNNYASLKLVNKQAIFA